MLHKLAMDYYSPITKVNTAITDKFHVISQICDFFFKKDLIQSRLEWQLLEFERQEERIEKVS